MHKRYTIISLAVVLALAIAVLAGCGDSTTTTTHETLPPTDSQDLGDMAALYDQACANCHGPLGDGGVSGVGLKDLTAAEQQMIVDAIRNGKGGMPASAGDLTDEQIEALARYVAGLE
jgi:mono/diheme cytochrome c family protein